ncbi:MAG: ABC transporter substrate-binding protein [Actinomadura sp.]
MKKRTALAALAAIAMTAVTACTASTSDGQGAGDVRIGQEYDLGTLDPAVLTSVGDRQMTANLFEGLVRYKLGGVDVGPGLATEWSHNTKGTSWTFKLRQGVPFQKGYGEMKAGDVAFSLKRILSKELASPNAALLGSVKDVKAEGDYTVVIDLDKPDPSLTDKLASWYTGIVSEKAVTEKGDKFAHDPVGTGPYQFDHWTQGQETVLTANDAYWGGKPKLGRVIYKAIPDVTTRNNAFQAGEIDIIQVTDPDILARYKSDSKFQISPVPGLITRFFGMNSENKPFDDARVREAVSLAIDRPAMLDGIFKGISEPAAGILSPEVKHAKKGIIDYRHDPARAKQLLSEAGYPNGVDVTFSVPNVDRFSRPATVIQQDLAKVGIRVKIRIMETQSLLAALASDKGLQMFILSRGQDPTPDRVLSGWFGSSGIPANNWARIKDNDVDEWLAQAGATLDETKREELFGKVQQRVADGNYYYYIDHEQFIFALQPAVKGFVGDPQRSIRLDNVSIAK